MVDTAAENPLLQQKLPVPAFASLTNLQGVQNQANVVTSQAGAAQETEAANIASAELERALATLQQRRQDLQAAQADKVRAEAEAQAAAQALSQAQNQLATMQAQAKTLEAQLPDKQVKLSQTAQRYEDVYA